MTVATPLLEAHGVVKRFGALLANDVAAFAVQAGEVVALVERTAPAKALSAKSSMATTGPMRASFGLRANR